MLYWAANVNAARRSSMRYPSLTRKAAAILGLAALLATACSADTDSDPSGNAAQGDQPVFPRAEWQRVDPAEAGFDPAVLGQIATEAEASGSNCMIVTRHGQIVDERYWNGTDAATTQDVFSATKSITSTLVGIAQADGNLDVHDAASTYIPQWAGTPAEEVTIEDLLSNDSGRHWDLATDYRDLVAAPDRTTFGIGLAQDSPPGEAWAYNNAAIQTLDAVLESATGQDPAAYTDERLLAPIGMTDSEMTHDSAGNTNTFFGLQSTCEDMARFGYLFLHGGNWDGTEIVPQDWVDTATGQPSQDLNAAYGYLWWLNHRGRITGALRPITGRDSADISDGRLVDTAPADMYWAIGFGGQIVQIHPATDTVVVRLGPGGRGRPTADGSTATYGPANTARVVTEALTRP
jgi:CubicO group peptidase (beta-lactamase class C family)